MTEREQKVAHWDWAWAWRRRPAHPAQLLPARRLRPRLRPRRRARTRPQRDAVRGGHADQHDLGHPRALTRTTALAATSALLSAGGALDAPLGMTLAPNGDLIVVNGNNGDAVEITPAGKQLATRTLIRNGAGDLFGIITAPNGIVAVNDGANALDLFRG